MPTVLSISSHVVHGYVGNRAMVFPLEYCGWNVDILNTTNYSNHPGYGKFKGTKLGTQEVEDLFQGLGEILDLKIEYDMIITGYTPSEYVLDIVYSQISDILAYNRGSIWVVDPVLGDNGKLYVSEKIIPVYEKMLSSGKVTLTTPNQFEFEILSGVKIDNNWDNLIIAIKSFVTKYSIPFFVISSIVMEIDGDSQMYTVGYRKNKVFYFKLSQIKCNFNGCGDLFTALLCNAFYSNGCDLTVSVLGNVHRKLNKVLQYSYECEQEINQNKFSVVKDLRIISSRHIFLEEDDSHDFNEVYIDL